MSLTTGTRLGAYQVTALLGEGGMGQVYRARDAKLKRDVALKVLPAEVATDRERLARFQREAEVLASLNHPNIAHIHGLEEADGVTALVMEIVEGEDLSQRIARGAIPIDEALPDHRDPDLASPLTKGRWQETESGRQRLGGGPGSTTCLRRLAPRPFTVRVRQQLAFE